MKNLHLILITIFCFACNKFEVDFKEEINSTNFIATMDENPRQGFEIGTIDASSSFGRINFTVLSQNPEGFINVTDKKIGGGVITVADSALFDFETNPVLESRVRIFNPEAADTIVVRLTLRDLDE